jgi:hypothetical protein
MALQVEQKMDESAKEAEKSGLTVPGSYNPHSVHRTAGARPIAISCLALFGRRPIERVAAIVFAGIQKPAH